jgi:hypothetical protein
MKSASAGILLWLLAVAGRAQTAADYQVVFGTGSPDPWGSSITVSSTSSGLTHVILSAAPDKVCTPFAPCATLADVDGFATLTLTPPQFQEVGLTYVGSIGSVFRPAIAARAFDNMGRSVDLPVFRLDYLLALDPGTLAFAGAVGGQSGRSHLLLANLGPIGQTEVGQVLLEINVMNAAGFFQVSRHVLLNFRDTLFIQNVIAWAGLPSLDQGQVIVTKRGGSGTFFGVMPVIRADGSLSVVSGSPP